MKTRLILYLLLLISCTGIAQDRWGFSFAYPTALNLTNTMPMVQVAKTQKVLGAVGGISYDQIAQPIEGISINTLNINYLSDNFDGERIELIVNGQKINVELYDWQMIPIADFANSESYSCFTYFGDLVDNNLENLILENGGHILNYHKSFKNTLLGWRLLDMDLLILYDFTFDLPKEDNQYLLGAGEQEPVTWENREGINNFIIHIQNIENDLNQMFRSYVLSDYNQDIRFSTDDNILQLTGNPYYFCWRYRFDNPSFNEDAEWKKVYQQYETIRNEEQNKNPSFDIQAFIIDSLLSKAEQYAESFNIFTEGTFIDLVNLPPDRQTRVNFLELYDINDLYQMLVDVSYYMVAYTPEYLEEFSNRMSDVTLLEKTNPAVWIANVNIMRYAAFFRYIKINFPEEWDSFINSVSGVSPQPQAHTPTVIYDTGNSAIEDALANSSVNDEFLQDVKINPYPNPFNDCINLGNSEPLRSAKIFSINGQLYRHVSPCPVYHTISLSDLRQGTYFLEITYDDNRKVNYKLIKK
ncbi:MAG: T9SS type A sorting domain-containing protein [Prolixibacteraceae bacterium]|nr:T9SS type A sorting domain-containing protein [Prolixibacteraceae bacterium]